MFAHLESSRIHLETMVSQTKEFLVVLERCSPANIIKGRRHDLLTINAFQMKKANAFEPWSSFPLSRVGVSREM